MKINYVKYKNINTEKWDKCINISLNKCVTASSDFLDIAYTEWDALIFDDYKIVMPIPIKSSFIFKNSETNIFTPNLGIYGFQLSEEIIKSFIDEFFKHISKAQYFLNKYNFYNNISSKAIVKTAYEFDIIFGGNFLKNSSQKCVNIIDNAIPNYTISKHLYANRLINFTEQKTVVCSNNLEQSYKDKLLKTMAYTLRKNLSEILVARDKRNQIVGFLYFINSYEKKILILAGGTKNSINKGVIHLLISNYLKNLDQNNITVNFGCISENFAQIFEEFGFKKYNFLQLSKTRIL